MKRLTFFIAFMSFAVTAQASDFLYILSAQAKILAEPTFNSALVDRVSKGEKLVALGKKNNRWFKVRYNGKEGWVSRLAVSPNPPSKRRHRLAKADKAIVDNARRRASSNSTTAAVRGLRGEERSRANLVDANYAALNMVEDTLIRDQEAIAFLNDRR